MYELDKHTVSLLHFDDGFKDETGKVWTAVNSPAIVESPSKFGNGAFYKNGANSYLQYAGTDYGDFNLGTDDFTVDFWFYSPDNYSSTAHYSRVFNLGVTPANTNYVSNPESGTSICTEFSVGNTKYLGSVPRLWICYVTSSKWYIFGSDQITITNNTWHHAAFVRKDGVFYFFFNGNLVGTKSGLTIDIAKPSSSVNIGLRSGVPSELTNTYYDEFRISNIARWTEDFDPAHTDDGKFLLTITLAEEVEREYPVTKDELDAFIKWYDSRANGTGSAYYTFDKFLNRKDYIVYDKILTFEVTDFSKQV